MAKYGPASITVNYNSQDITQYVQEINGVSVEQIIEEVHTFGDSWEEHLPVGIGRMTVVELSGIYDDTAVSGPDALFADNIPETPASSAKVLVITWGAAKTTTVSTFLLSYERTADRNALTRYTARLQPTGSVVEA